MNVLLWLRLQDSVFIVVEINIWMDIWKWIFSIRLFAKKKITIPYQTFFPRLSFARMELRKDFFVHLTQL